jgi:hypothetical protein
MSPGIEPRILKECRSALAFQVKPTWVCGQIVGEKFQSDEAAEVGVLCFVNHTHPPTTELLDDAVVRDGLPDEGLGIRHVAAILVFPNRRQVNEPAQHRPHT